jgi:hypothetical protein
MRSYICVCLFALRPPLLSASLLGFPHDLLLKSLFQLTKARGKIVAGTHHLHDAYCVCPFLGDHCIVEAGAVVVMTPHLLSPQSSLRGQLGQCTNRFLTAWRRGWENHIHRRRAAGVGHVAVQ